MNTDDLNIRVIIDPCISANMFPPASPKFLEANSLFLSLYATRLSHNLFMNDNPNREHHVDMNITPHESINPELTQGMSFDMVNIDITYSTAQREIADLTHIQGNEMPVFTHYTAPDFNTVEDLFNLSAGTVISEDKMHEWSQTAIKSCSFVVLEGVFTDTEHRPHAIFPMVMSIIGGALSTLIKGKPDDTFSQYMRVHFANMKAMISALPEEYKISTDALHNVIIATEEAVSTRTSEDISVAYNMYVSISPLVRSFLES